MASVTRSTQVRILSSSVPIEVLFKRGEEERSVLGQAGGFNGTALPGRVNEQVSD